MENDELNQDVIVPEDESLENDELDNLSEDDIPTVEDYQKALKQIATLKAQKEHFKKKATAVNQPKQEPIKKEAEIKQEQPNFEEQMDIRFLQRDGLTLEDIEKLKIIRDGYKSLGKNISLIEAQNDNLFKAYKQEQEAEIKRGKAQLGASGGGTPQPKQMTQEEFEKIRADKSKEYLKSLYPMS